MPPPSKFKVKQGNFSYYIGWAGEFLAIAYFKLCGYTIIRHRQKTHLGEIDLILRKGKVCVFVEIKTSWHGKDIEYRLSSQQQIRNRRAALWWIAQHPAYQQSDLRLDAMFISWRGFKHLPNISITDRF